MAFWASSQWASGLLSTFSGSQNLFWAFSRASQKPTFSEASGSPLWEEAQKPLKRLGSQKPALEEARGFNLGPEKVKPERPCGLLAKGSEDVPT